MHAALHQQCVFTESIDIDDLIRHIIGALSHLPDDEESPIRHYDDNDEQDDEDDFWGEALTLPLRDVGIALLRYDVREEQQEVDQDE